jgi:3-amino-5-hydroxybenzoic acid synthesis related protein
MTRAVIFDLDGVLIDSSKVMQQAFEHAWRQFFEQGIAPFAEYKTHMGKGFISIMDAMGLPRAMAAPFRERSVELADQIELFPGVFALLESLVDEGTYLGVSTGKEAARTHYILRRHGLDGYFERVVCSDQVAQGKPHPESIDIHLVASGVSAAEALFVGDAQADIECAQRAGVPSIAVLWGMGTEAALRAMNPTHVVRDFGELHRLLVRAVRASRRTADRRPEMVA